MGSEACVLKLRYLREVLKPTKLCLWCMGLSLADAVFLPLQPAARPVAQLLMVPLVSLFLWKTRIQGVRVPRVVFVAAFFSIAVGVVLRFSTVHLRDGAFVVATVSKRELGQETKIYRDRLHRALGAEDRTLAGLYRGEVGSQGAAELVLEKRPALGGVIWGSPRWMTVSFRRVPGLSLGSLDQKSFAKIWLVTNKWDDLRVVRSVPSVGVSHGHQDATVHFIASLLQSWNKFTQRSGLVSDDPELELRLSALVRHEARWSSHSHIAYALWLRGSYHLIQAIQGASMSEGDLRCALKDFSDALAQFRQRDNPSLYAAIQNNFGLAMLVQADYSDKPDKIRRHALKRIKVAQRISMSQNGGDKEIVRNSEALGISSGGKRRNARK